MGFRVINASTRETLPGIPTPRLIESGYAEAFEKDGVWFLREDGTMHVSPDGQYTKVQVLATSDWRVDLNIRVIDQSYHEDDPDAPQPYDDYFIVEAADRREAEDKAMALARADVADRYDGGEGTDISIIRAREGVSI